MNMYHPISNEDVVALESLIDKLDGKKIDVLEIGCGRSTDGFLKRCNVTIVEINRERAERYKDRAEIHVCSSSEFVPCKKYDLIFIDGDHTYGAIKKDIEIYSKAVKDGGILSGHDYEGGGFNEKYIYDDCVEGKHHGVIKAVDEAFGANVHKNGTCVWWMK